MGDIINITTNKTEIIEIGDGVTEEIIVAVTDTIIIDGVGFSNGGGGGHIIQDDGVDLPQEQKLNFIGAIVTDNPANESTDVEFEGVTKHSELDLDDGTNPHGTTQSDVGLSEVDNTSDADKPISDATQTALDNKEDAFTKNTAFNKDFGSATNTVCEGDDPRLSDSRPPTTHAITHEIGGLDQLDGSNLFNNTSVTNYIPLSDTDKGHLKGIDDKLGVLDTEQTAQDGLIQDNADDITTINENAIFSDPASPVEIDFGWAGTRAEFDLITPNSNTLYFLAPLPPFLNSVTVTGLTPVNIGASEIYTATADTNAIDLTYLWTVTGTTDATINGSNTDSTVLVDYAGTEGAPDSFADIKCVVSSVSAGDSVEDTLQVTIEHESIIPQDYTSAYLTPFNGDNVATVPTDLVTTWFDENGINDIAQANESNMFSLVDGEYLESFDTDAFMNTLGDELGNFTYVIKIRAESTGGSFLAGGNFCRLGRGNGFFEVYTDQNTRHLFLNLDLVEGVDGVVTIRKEGSIIKITLDGVLSTTVINIGTDTIDFNAVGRGSDGLQGRYYYLYQYPRALSDAEIATFN